jgi:N6-L-threonylcarbamoyladenine synthase
MLGLPYPGGPHLSKLAAVERTTNAPSVAHAPFKLPRPMLHSGDLNFSFSGLKTSVLYAIKKFPDPLDDTAKRLIAREFEDAVVEVLVEKTRKAIEDHQAKTLIIGGGVIANEQIRAACTQLESQFPGLQVLIPDMTLTTDNATMIAMAAYLRASLDQAVLTTNPDTIRAQGNLRL